MNHVSDDNFSRIHSIFVKRNACLLGAGPKAKIPHVKLVLLRNRKGIPAFPAEAHKGVQWNGDF